MSDYKPTEAGPPELQQEYCRRCGHLGWVWRLAVFSRNDSRPRAECGGCGRLIGYADLNNPEGWLALGLGERLAQLRQAAGMTARKATSKKKQPGSSGLF